MVELNPQVADPHRRRRKAGLSALLARLDWLVDLVAERRRIEAVERPLRARLAAEMATYARRGGLHQFRRPGGLVSLVAPQPRWDVFDEQAFAGWLVANGHDQLVTERVVVTDHPSLIALLRGTSRPGRVSASKLDACLAVVVEPDADAPDHLSVKVDDDGRLVARDGEVIPGVRRVTRAPWVRVCSAAPTPQTTVGVGGQLRRWDDATSTFSSTVDG